MRYLVVERAELGAATERGRSLRGLVEKRARAAPVAAFPAREGGDSADVLIFELVSRPRAGEDAS
jgi:hypothetical protein